MAGVMRGAAVESVMGLVCLEAMVQPGSGLTCLTWAALRVVVESENCLSGSASVPLADSRPVK